jgi:GEVED domain
MRKKLFIYLIGLVSFGMLKAQYCVTNLGGFCTAAAISNFSISGTSLNNSSGCSTGVGGQAYSFYTPTANTSATLIKGQQYTLNISTTSGSPQEVKVYIDFNKDLDWLDAGEEIIVCAGCTSGQPVYSATFTVPLSAVTDTTRLRVRTRQFIIADACENIGSGETEDYLIYLDPGVPCTGTPIVGTTQSSDTTACLGQLVTFSMNGLAPAGDLTYQWQINGINSPSDTNSFLVDTISGPNTYQCFVTCINSGQTATSTPLSITINPFSVCYCSISSTSTFGTDIGNVTIGSFSNGTASPIIGNAGANATYTNFNSLPPVALLSGIPNNIQITGITSSTFVSGTVINASVYIDYNQDGAYDPVTELAVTGTGNFTGVNGSVISGNPLIPSSALTGVTGMRVMLYESFASNPCIAPAFSGGETEDYLVDIQAAVPCSGTPVAGSTQSNDTVICSGQAITLSLNGSAAGSGITYQWYANGVISPNDTLPNLTTVVNAPTSYYCVLTCVNGGATAQSTTLAITFDTPNNCLCTSSSTSTADEDIGQVSFGSLINGSGCTPVSSNANANSSGYSNFKSSLPPTTIFKGVPTPISVCIINAGGSLYGTSVKVFIDINNDGVFKDSLNTVTPTGEVFVAQVLANISTTRTASALVTIPSSAVSDTVVMRIVGNETSTLNDVKPCGTYTWGETEDYLLVLDVSAACTGTPNAGSVASNDTAVCALTNFTLSLNGASVGSDLTYQWQANGVNLLNDTLPVLTTSMSANTIYTCIVTCTVSGQFSTSTPLTVTLNPFSQCYCPITSSSTFGTDIGNVTVGGFSNGSASPIIGNINAINTYTDYTGLAPIPLLSSIPNNIQVTGITSSTFVGFTTLNGSVYIDYNQDGTYDPITELAFSGTGNFTAVNGSVISGNPVIPSSALSGVTGMRVMLYEGFFSNACNPPSFTGGETEDYLVDIQPAVPCSGAPVGGNSTTSDTVICPNTLVSLNVQGSTLASGINYQWQSSSTLAGFYTNVANGTNLLYSSSSVASPTYFQP